MRTTVQSRLGAPETRRVLQTSLACLVVGWLVVHQAWAATPNGTTSILEQATALKMNTDYDEAERLLLDALHDAETLDDAALEIRLTVKLGDIINRRNLHRNIIDDPALLARLERALNLAVGVGRSDLIGAAHQVLAQYHYRRELAADRLFPLTDQHATLALESFQAVADSYEAGVAVHRQGLIALQKRNLDEARELFDESLRLTRTDKHDPRFEADYHRHIGFVEMLSGNTESAIIHFRQSIPLRREASFRDGVMFSLITLGSVLVNVGKIEEAVPLLTEADDIADSIGSPVGMTRADLYLGDLYRASGDDCRANERYRRARQHARSIAETDVVERASAAIQGLGFAQTAECDSVSVP